MKKHFTQNSLVLLRGLVGAGKSTLAQLLSENGKYPVFSVDDYFTNAITQEYSFDFSKNHLAYKYCENNTEEAMIKQNKKILVHNTFTIDWELEPYFKLAQKYQYQIFVVTVENYHQSGNIHQIPDDQILKMAQKYKVKLY